MREVLTHRDGGDSGGREYHVCWEGYPDEADNTWEPEENILANAGEKVQEYLLQHGLEGARAAAAGGDDNGIDAGAGRDRAQAQANAETVSGDTASGAAGGKAAGGGGARLGAVTLTTVQAQSSPGAGKRDGAGAGAGASMADSGTDTRSDGGSRAVGGRSSEPVGPTLPAPTATKSGHRSKPRGQFDPTPVTRGATPRDSSEAKGARAAKRQSASTAQGAQGGGSKKQAKGTAQGPLLTAKEISELRLGSKKEKRQWLDIKNVRENALQRWRDNHVANGGERPAALGPALC